MAELRAGCERIKTLIFRVSWRILMGMNKLWGYVPERFICRRIPDKSLSKVEFVSALRNVLGDVSDMTIDNADPKVKDRIHFLANQSLANKFNFLGSGWVTLDPMVWNIDLRTKQTWPRHMFYMKQKAETPMGADIKSPWELSRGHFLLWLGEAYLLTKDERYAKKIVTFLNNWIDDNPLMYTVNWTCSMDVAIRAVNWMYALTMISRSTAFTETFADKVILSLYQHGFFISHNLEKTEPWSNNHYTSDIVGLLYIGMLFGNTVKGRKWRKFAVKEFYDQTRKQMLPSGVNYEKSISYHRLMVELTSYPLAMLIRTGETIPKDIIKQTQKMYDYVGVYLKPNGYAPLLADNDDGRFLPFTYGEFRNHEYLLDANGIDQRIVNIGISPIFNLCHSEQSQVYQDAGIAIVKKQGAYLLINNSGYSRYIKPGKTRISTHTHNDQLSFELSIAKDDIFIDPGTYVYTSSIKERNAFRSTRKHNTVMVDNEEQNMLSETNAFLMRINNTDRVIKVDGNNYMGSYETIQGGLHHERIFNITDGRLRITDTLTKRGKGHIGEIYFHLCDKVIPSFENDNSVSLKSPQYAVQLSFDGYDITGRLATKILDDIWSPSYGVLHQTKMIKSIFSFDERCSIITIIEWVRR